MKPTPRTDAEMLKVWIKSEDACCEVWAEKDGDTIDVVDADFARQLEREIAAMREAMMEAVRAINLAKNSLHQASDPRVRVQWSEDCMENKLCNSALAKLKPFLK